jgi:hypothetical protein
MPARNDVVKKSLVILLLFFLTSFVAAQTSTLIPFNIKDQFDKDHTNADFGGIITIVIESDRGGSEYNPRWGKAIRDSLSDDKVLDQVKFLRVADLRAVPILLKNAARGKFRAEEKDSVLMDWKGEFAITYQLEPKACNILIFSRSGALIHKTYGQDIDAQKLGVILTKLKALTK